MCSSCILRTGKRIALHVDTMPNSGAVLTVTLLGAAHANCQPQSAPHHAILSAGRCLGRYPLRGPYGRHHKPIKPEAIDLFKIESKRESSDASQGFKNLMSDCPNALAIGGSDLVEPCSSHLRRLRRQRADRRQAVGLLAR